MNNTTLPRLNRPAWDALPYQQEFDIKIPGGIPCKVKLTKSAMLFEDKSWNAAFIIDYIGPRPEGYPNDFGRYSKIGTLMILTKGAEVQHAISIEEPEMVTEEPWGTPVDMRYNPMRMYTKDFVQSLVEQLYAKTIDMKPRLVEAKKI